MIIRVLCGIIIVLGFCYLGFLYAERLKKRIYQIEWFCDGLSVLAFNIRYMNYPMAEAFEYAGKNSSDVVSEIFNQCAKIMQNDRSKSAGEVFAITIDDKIKALNISKDEVEILKSFSKTLGDCDREAEINNIETAKLRLNASLADAKDDVLKKVKMSRGVGFLLGLFIVIVLI